MDRKRKTESSSEGQAQPSPTKKQRLLPTSSPKFTVTYSRLCDGGAQEMNTAVAAVREIFPDATIRTNRRNQEEDIGVANPFVVISLGGSGIQKTTSSSTDNNSSSNNRNAVEDDVLWSSKQRNLYQKYPKKRRRSIKDIRKKLEILKTSLQTTETTETTTTAVQAAATTTTSATTSPKVHAPARTVSNDHDIEHAFEEDDIEDEVVVGCSGSCPIVR